MRRQHGFSLVEILVALLILTVVITTSMAAFIERGKRLQQASETIMAWQILANESEYRRRMPYATLEEEPKEFVTDLTALAPMVPYQTFVAVTQTNPGVKNVLMLIRWKEGKREEKLEIVRVDTGGTSLW